MSYSNSSQSYEGELFSYVADCVQQKASVEQCQFRFHLPVQKQAEHYVAEELKTAGSGIRDTERKFRTSLVMSTKVALNNTFHAFSFNENLWWFQACYPVLEISVPEMSVA